MCTQVSPESQPSGKHLRTFSGSSSHILTAICLCSRSSIQIAEVYLNHWRRYRLHRISDGIAVCSSQNRNRHIQHCDQVCSSWTHNERRSSDSRLLPQSFELHADAPQSRPLYVKQMISSVILQGPRTLRYTYHSCPERTPPSSQACCQRASRIPLSQPM